MPLCRGTVGNLESLTSSRDQKLCRRTSHGAFRSSITTQFIHPELAPIGNLYSSLQGLECITQQFILPADP